MYFVPNGTWCMAIAKLIKRWSKSISPLSPPQPKIKNRTNTGVVARH
jgi:hypothetical protein